MVTVISSCNELSLWYHCRHNVATACSVYFSCDAVVVALLMLLRWCHCKHKLCVCVSSQCDDVVVALLTLFRWCHFKHKLCCCFCPSVTTWWWRC